MVAIDHHTSQFKVTEYSKYSIPAWQSWCRKNDIDFMVVTEHDERFDKPIWNKELVFKNIGKEYDIPNYLVAEFWVNSKWSKANEIAIGVYLNLLEKPFGDAATSTESEIV